MPALLTDNFQDHYALLGIDAQSVSETMQRAYAALARKYHPNNSVTGDAEKFDAVSLAYEVLSDPVRRREFDELHHVGQEASGPKFSGAEFFSALGRDESLRSALLCLLYDHRRGRPSAPGVAMRTLETMVEATAVELSSALWYLKQRGLAASDDKSSLQITADGMDFLVSHKPSIEDVMAFIKPAAMKTQEPSGKREPESSMSRLNRALVRTTD